MGFLRTFDVLITTKEGNAEFSKCFELGKPFFILISSVSVLWNTFWEILIQAEEEVVGRE